MRPKREPLFPHGRYQLHESCFLVYVLILIVALLLVNNSVLVDKSTLAVTSF